MKRENRLQTRRAVSAGGVVYRRIAGEVAVLLVETPGGQWGLPKGTPGGDEKLEEAAVREVVEETGLQVDREGKIGTIEYWFVRAEEGQRVHKYVHFWLMRPTGGSIADHDAEHISVRWFSLERGIERATHENTKTILRKAAALLDAGEAAFEATGPSDTG
ncbi:MAG: NUDIX hydrolase [Chloroflexi bacterium]|nr:NUDIX hydrolase [Chloroflexota bacterium]